MALWAGVGLLGGFAALARFLLQGYVSRRSRTRPLGTLAVNISGSLLVGVLLGGGVHGDAYLLAGTATLGSYTTFSTWVFEAEREARSGRGAIAVATIVGSLILGVAAVALGRFIAGG